MGCIAFTWTIEFALILSVVYKFLSANERSDVVFKTNPHGSFLLHNITKTQPFGLGCIINLPLEYCTQLVPCVVQFINMEDLLYNPRTSGCTVYHRGRFIVHPLYLRVYSLSSRKIYCTPLVPQGVQFIIEEDLLYTPCTSGCTVYHWGRFIVHPLYLRVYSLSSRKIYCTPLVPQGVQFIIEEDLLYTPCTSGCTVYHCGRFIIHHSYLVVYSIHRGRFIIHPEPNGCVFV